MPLNKICRGGPPGRKARASELVTVVINETRCLVAAWFSLRGTSGAPLIHKVPMFFEPNSFMWMPFWSTPSISKSCPKTHTPNVRILNVVSHMHVIRCLNLAKDTLYLRFGFRRTMLYSLFHLANHDLLPEKAFTHIRYEEKPVHDTAGKVVQTWTGSGGQTSSYLLPNGNLLRNTNTPAGRVFGSNGATGRIEELAWDSSVVWTFDMQTEKYQNAECAKANHMQ